VRGRARRRWRATRIGDLERNHALETLARHYEDGRLSFDEFDDRTSVAAVARTNGELERVLRELPALPDPGRLALPVRLYLVANAGLVLFWFMTRDPQHSVTGQNEFWPLWPILIWGAILALRTYRRPQRRRALRPGR
jgi:hypothetical protein